MVGLSDCAKLLKSSNIKKNVALTGNCMRLNHKKKMLQERMVNFHTDH